MNVSLLATLNKVIQDITLEKRTSDENIMHSEVPGFKAKKIKKEDFRHMVKSKSAAPMGVTHANHVPLTVMPGEEVAEIEDLEVGVETDVDASGNTVSLFHEMAKASEIKARQETMVSLQRTLIQMYKTVLDKA